MYWVLHIWNFICIISLILITCLGVIWYLNYHHYYYFIHFIIEETETLYKLRKLPKVTLHLNGSAQALNNCASLSYPSAQRNFTKGQKIARIWLKISVAGSAAERLSCWELSIVEFLWWEQLLLWSLKKHYLVMMLVTKPLNICYSKCGLQTASPTLVVYTLRAFPNPAESAW